MDEPVGDDGLPSSVGELNGADGDRVIDAKRMELLMEFMEWCYWALNAGLPLLWRAWADIVKASIRRYRRFVSGPSVKDHPPAERRWKMYEALWVTPMVVLEAKKEHEEGLGRLLHKWLEAFHAWWCVFLPDALELGFRSTVKYWVGSKAECRRTVDRACCVGRGFWSFVSLLLYAVLYTVVYVYEFVEWACWGVTGVGILVAAANYLAATGSFTAKDGVVLDEGTVEATGTVVLIGAASRLLRWYETSSGGRSPMEMAGDRYARWMKDLEEQEQAERLSEAFWRMDGYVGPRPRVPTLSELHAERCANRERLRELERERAARRGRRVSVGEDVTSENNGHRLGDGYDRTVPDNRSTSYQVREDQLYEDALDNPTVAHSGSRAKDRRHGGRR
eukprot:jgi/Phyca11/10369/fgenesh1_pm.PHYCAscaffold_49_\